MDDPFTAEPAGDRPEPDGSAEEDAAAVRRERDWLLDMLRDTVAERQRQDEREQLIVCNARLAGIGWDVIAEALGMTAVTSLEKHGEPEPGEAPF